MRRMSTKRYVRIVNDFAHDMATGTWVACLLVIWILSRRLPNMPEEAASALGDAMSFVFWLGVVALAVIFVTGGLRLRYWRRETALADLVAKRRALLIKHATFLVVYGSCTWWIWSVLP